MLVALGRKLTAVFLVLTVVMPMSGVANAGCLTDVNSTTQQSSGFENVSLAPWALCTYKSPNYGQVTSAEAYKGSRSYQFFWQEAGYDGTRDARGIEACGDLRTYKEGWYGFEFYLPSPGYPKDKTAAIAQIFQDGACSSWGALLIVENGALHLQYRDYCGTPTDVVIASSIQYNAWKPIIIHWVASHEGAGQMQVWYAGQTCSTCQNSPTYSATNINFGFGTWNSNDTLATGNDQYWKFGMYNFDDTHYTTNETRTLYFDCVNQIVGGSGTDSAAFDNVNPVT
jgi:hypothetical protein